MFDFIKRLFGKGVIRCELRTADGRKGTAKIPYIGDFSTLDMPEFIQHVIKQAWINNGERVVDVKIIGWY